MKLFKRKKYTDKYLTNLIIKAGNLARYWALEIKKASLNMDIVRLKRITNHLYRIAKIQAMAQTIRDDR